MGKRTIKKTDRYHLYEEAFDNLNIHLSLKDVEFKVIHNWYGLTSEKKLTIIIPRDIMSEVAEKYLEEHGEKL